MENLESGLFYDCCMVKKDTRSIRSKAQLRSAVCLPFAVKIVEGSCRLAQPYSLEANESLERAEWNPRQIRFNLSI
jgi:hypothetical protein